MEKESNVSHTGLRTLDDFYKCVLMTLWELQRECYWKYQPLSQRNFHEFILSTNINDNSICFLTPSLWYKKYHTPMALQKYQIIIFPSILCTSRYYFERKCLLLILWHALKNQIPLVAFDSEFRNDLFFRPPLWKEPPAFIGSKTIAHLYIYSVMSPICIHLNNVKNGIQIRNLYFQSKTKKKLPEQLGTRGNFHFTYYYTIYPSLIIV